MKANHRALTSLRFFAAFGVVIFHYGTRVKGSELLPSPVHNLIYRAPAALCFFFILSGFVLTLSYQDKVDTPSKGRRSFWFARFARLYPAYILAFLLFIPVAVDKYILRPAPGASATAHVTFVAGALLSPMLLQSWTSFSQAWNGPSWSLSVEAFFYFLFPIIAFRLMRQSAAVAVTLVLSLWAVTQIVVCAYVTGHIPRQFYHDYVQYHPLFWTPCFLVGIALGRFVRIWQRVSAATASATMLLTAAGVVAICALSPPRYGEYIVTTGLLPLLALMILCCTHLSSSVVLILGSSPLYELGDVSYITYILQAPLWHLLTVATNRMSGHSLTAKDMTVSQFVVFTSILLGVSFFVSVYVDRPARTWIFRLANNPDRSIAAGLGPLSGIAQVLRCIPYDPCRPLRRNAGAVRTARGRGTNKDLTDPGSPRGTNGGEDSVGPALARHNVR